MRKAGIPLTLFACLGLSACWVEVPVPSSGSVATESGSMSCAAGTTCSLDVADIHFDETFVATPADGFVFHSWKSGDRRLCGDQTGPCRYYTAPLEGNDDAIALLSDQEQVLYVEPYFQSTGFNALFIGHSFFNPIASAMPGLVETAGIPNHTQERFMSGGATGSPEAL